MKSSDILDRLTSVSVWTSGDRRAPHKPLLLLLALARCSRGEPREIPYREVDQKLGALLREFGPPSKSYHPEYPFWRLQNDGIWLVRDADNLALRTGHSDVRKSELLRTNVPGGLIPEIYTALQKDHRLLVEVAAAILDAHFPASMHSDILSAVGLELERASSSRAKRDPAFRDKVLRAYERRCAICGFDLRLGTVDVALEAAHIMWHEAGGPDVECNGLALCTLHHKLLDRGAFTVSAERRLLVSQSVSGSEGLREQLMRFHAKPIREPQSREYMPSLEYLAWHGREVFREPARAL
ncbi:MAG: HNH endonuclease [bacterium]|nr:HNH endonuclease [bacterium]